MPYLLAFETLTPENPWFWFEILVDVIFGLDMIVILNSAYYNNKYELVTSKWMIFKHYFFGMMMIDFLAIFPFYAFENDPNGAGARSNRFIRLFRLARLTRIFRAVKLFSLFKSLEKSEVANEWLNFWRVNRGLLRLLLFLFSVLILAHFAACLWYLVARFDDFGYETWVFRGDMMDKPKPYLYLVSLYWSFTTLTTVGYGDVNAVSENEMVLALIWMMFGVGTYSFIIGTFTSVLQNYDARQIIIDERTKLMDLYSKEYKLPSSLHGKLSHYIQNDKEVTSLEFGEKQDFLMSLPKDMRLSIANKLQNKAIRNVDFFNELGKDFLANVVPLLNFRETERNNVVYSTGDYADEIYFLVSGKVNYTFGEQHIVFKSMLQGSYFGEIEVMEKVPREFSVVTDTNVTLLIMVKKLLDLVRKEYPGVVLDMRTTSKQRKEKNKESLEEMRAVVAHVDARNAVSVSADEASEGEQDDSVFDQLPQMNRNAVSLKTQSTSGPLDTRRSSLSRSSFSLQPSTAPFSTRRSSFNVGTPIQELHRNQFNNSTPLINFQYEECISSPEKESTTEPPVQPPNVPVTRQKYKIQSAPKMKLNRTSSQPSISEVQTEEIQTQLSEIKEEQSNLRVDFQKLDHKLDALAVNMQTLTEYIQNQSSQNSDDNNSNSDDNNTNSPKGSPPGSLAAPSRSSSSSRASSVLSASSYDVVINKPCD